MTPFCRLLARALLLPLAVAAAFVLAYPNNERRRRPLDRPLASEIPDVLAFEPPGWYEDEQGVSRPWPYGTIREESLN